MMYLGRAIIETDEKDLHKMASDNWPVLQRSVGFIGRGSVCKVQHFEDFWQFMQAWLVEIKNKVGTLVEENAGEQQQQQQQHEEWGKE